MIGVLKLLGSERDVQEGSLIAGLLLFRLHENDGQYCYSSLLTTCYHLLRSGRAPSLCYHQFYHYASL